MLLACHVCACVYVWMRVLCHMQDSRRSCRLSVRAILEQTGKSSYYAHSNHNQPQNQTVSPKGYE